jgi:hypothetical protein
MRAIKQSKSRSGYSAFSRDDIGVAADKELGHHSYPDDHRAANPAIPLPVAAKVCDEAWRLHNVRRRTTRTFKNSLQRSASVI